MSAEIWKDFGLLCLILELLDTFEKEPVLGVWFDVALFTCSAPLLPPPSPQNL